MPKRVDTDTKTWLVLNDLQIPWHDPLAVDLALDFARDLRPHGVILNGDIVDCYAISDFNKDPKRILKWGLDREIREARKLMSRLESVPEKWWLGGNHEDRWRRIQWEHARMQSMFKSLPEAFHMGDHGFQWRPYGHTLRLGKLTVTHGSVVRQHSGWSAKAHFEKYGGSILHGHTHRLGVYFRTNAKDTHAAYENGCLCRLNPEYVQYPDWQQGFSVVHVAPNGWFNVQQIPILRRRLFFFGAMKRGG